MANEWYTPIEKKTDTVVIDGYDVIVVGIGGCQCRNERIIQEELQVDKLFGYEKYCAFPAVRNKRRIIKKPPFGAFFISERFCRKLAALR